MAEQFNQHFLNVGPNLANLIPSTNEVPTKYLTNSPTASFFYVTSNRRIRVQLFSELNVNKSYLDISNKMIKLASRALLIPFAYIFTQSISTGIVPNALKISKVTPVYKKGVMTDPNNLGQ